MPSFPVVSVSHDVEFEYFLEEPPSPPPLVCVVLNVFPTDMATASPTEIRVTTESGNAANIQSAHAGNSL